MDTYSKKILLDIARRRVEAAVFRRPQPVFSCEHPDLQQKRGAFVTLKVRGQLRGCMGRFTSDTPLYKLVSELAVSAAIEDPRFEGNRIRPSELDSLEITISILSPLVPVKNPLDFELGKHGILIRKGFQTGCFLPEVARETGWSKEEFLSHCCWSKAGLSPDAWKQGDVEIYIFTTETVSSSDLS